MSIFLLGLWRLAKITNLWNLPIKKQFNYIGLKGLDNDGWYQDCVKVTIFSQNESINIFIYNKGRIELIIGVDYTGSVYQMLFQHMPT